MKSLLKEDSIVSLDWNLMDVLIKRGINIPESCNNLILKYFPLWLIKKFVKDNSKNLLIEDAYPIINTIYYLLSVGYSLTSNLLTKSVRDKNLNMVKFLIDRQCPYDLKTLKEIIIIGRTEFWETINPQVKDEDSYVLLCWSIHHNKQMIKFLISKGYSVNEDVYRFALMGNFYNDILQLISISKVIPGPWLFTQLVKKTNCSYYYFSKFKEAGLPYDETTIEAAKERGNGNIVKLFS